MYIYIYIYIYTYIYIYVYICIYQFFLILLIIRYIIQKLIDWIDKKINGPNSACLQRFKRQQRTWYYK